MFGRQMWRARAVVAVVGLLTAGRVSGATLTVGESTAVAGFLPVGVSVTLTSGGGEEVAALQFDISFDEAFVAFDSAIAGIAAVNANKNVSAGLVASDTVRVVVAGLNLDAIGDGEVARVFFAADSSAPDGPQALTVTNVVMSDPLGNEVPSSGESGTLNVQVLPLPVANRPSLHLAAAALGIMLGGVFMTFRMRSRRLVTPRGRRE